MITGQIAGANSDSSQTGSQIHGRFAISFLVSRVHFPTESIDKQSRERKFVQGVADFLILREIFAHGRSQLLGISECSELRLSLLGGEGRQYRQFTDQHFDDNPGY
jgi:hypothetical protein